MKLNYGITVAFLLIFLSGCFAYHSTGSDRSDRVVDRVSTELELNREQQAQLTLALKAIDYRANHLKNAEKLFTDGRFDSEQALKMFDSWSEAQRKDIKTALPLISNFYESLSKKQKHNVRKLVYSHWEGHNHGHYRHLWRR